MADRLARRTSFSKAVVREALDGVFAAIDDAVTNGEAVRIAEVGTFWMSGRQARTGRNARTGEPTSTSSSTSPKFKAGKTLKDLANADLGS